MSDLEQALTGEQPQEAAPVEEQPQQQEEQPQEAEAPAVEAEPPAPEEPKEEPKAEPQVPLSALLDVRRELQELKQGLPRPEAPKAPDMLSDPEGYTAFIAQQVQAAQTQTKLVTSRMMAEQEFGKDIVAKAFEFFNDRPAESQALMNHVSPFHAAVEAYQQHAVAQEIGNDPAAYRAKVEAEVRAQIEAEMVAKQAQAKVAQAAPSLANATGIGGGPRTNWTGPTPLENVLGS